MGKSLNEQLSGFVIEGIHKPFENTSKDIASSKNPL